MDSLNLYLSSAFLSLVLGSLTFRSKPHFAHVVGLMSWAFLGSWYGLKGAPAETSSLADWVYFQDLVLLSFQVLSTLVWCVALIKAGAHLSVGTTWMVYMALILTSYVLFETRVVGLGMACLAFSWLDWSLKWGFSQKTGDASEHRLLLTFPLSKYLGNIILFLGFMAFARLLKVDTVPDILGRRLECLLSDFSPWHVFSGGLLIVGCLMKAGLVPFTKPRIDNVGSFWTRAMLSTTSSLMAQMVLLRWSSYWSLFPFYQVFFSLLGLLGLAGASWRFFSTRDLYQAIEAQMAMLTSFLLVLLPWGMDELLRGWFLLSLWVRYWIFLMAGLLTSLLSYERDLSAMGGLRKKLPVTFTFWVSGVVLWICFWGWMGRQLVFQLSSTSSTWSALIFIMVGYFVFVGLCMRQLANLIDLIFLRTSRAHEWVLAYVQEMSWRLRGLLTLVLLAFVGVLGFLIRQSLCAEAEPSARYWVSTFFWISSWGCGLILALQRLFQQKVVLPAAPDESFRLLSLWKRKEKPAVWRGVNPVERTVHLCDQIIRNVQKKTQVLFTTLEKFLCHFLEGSFESGTTLFLGFCLLGIIVACVGWRLHAFS